MLQYSHVNVSSLALKIVISQETAAAPAAKNKKKIKSWEKFCRSYPNFIKRKKNAQRTYDNQWMDFKNINCQSIVVKIMLFLKEEFEKHIFFFF